MEESYPNGYKTLWGKGEIARYEQFLLFPQCFQKACFPVGSKGVCVWEWVNGIVKLYIEFYFFFLTFSLEVHLITFQPANSLANTPCENYPTDTKFLTKIIIIK